MFSITIKQLLEAGVHFGHPTKKWNPKMAEYIFTHRNGIHIVDLQKTVKKFEEACTYVRYLSEAGGTILFIGTKKQATDTIKDEATKCGMYYVNVRWPGGMLTNFKTIRKSIARLKELERMQEDGAIADAVIEGKGGETNETAETKTEEKTEEAAAEATAE